MRVGCVSACSNAYCGVHGGEEMTPGGTGQSSSRWNYALEANEQFSQCLGHAYRGVPRHGSLLCAASRGLGIRMSKRSALLYRAFKLVIANVTPTYSCQLANLLMPA